MRRLTLILCTGALTGCLGDSGGGSTSTSSATPATTPDSSPVTPPAASPTVSTPSPTPSPVSSPAVSPSPSPAPSPSPGPTPVSTSSFNSETCDLMTDGTVHCSGTASLTTTSNQYVSVVTGLSMACGIIDGQGQPYTCAYLSDANCLNSYVNAAAFCWNLSDGVQRIANVKAQLGFNNHYSAGPKGIRVRSDGSICINDEVYANLSTPWGQKQADYEICGTTVNSSTGYLQ